MSLNRSQVRIKVRDVLKDFYELDTIGVGGIDSSSASLPVTTVTLYKIGQVLQIDSELLIVREVDQENEELTVGRGHNASTAASHSAGAEIRIINEVTDRMLNDAIDRAVDDTYHDIEGGTAGIWFNVTNESLTTDIDTREYDVPSGLAFISMIEIEDDNGNHQITSRWRLVGSKIVFTADFANAGRTIRISGMGYQLHLADDSTNFTLTDEIVNSFIVYSAALHILEMRLGPRIKATEYAASVNDRAGQPIEMLQIISGWRNRVASIKRRESKPMRSGYANLGVR